MEIKTILAPSDFSQDAERAIETATSLAKSFGARLRLLHVVQPPVQPAGPELAVAPVAFWRELHDNAAKRLALVKEKVAAAGVACDVEVIDDMPGFAIADAAERSHADLIVMGSRGLTGLKHLVLGSVAERTVRYAKCPVLTVKDHGRALAFRTIVVPMDFSPGAKQALELAKWFAKKSGPAHLVLVHAYYVPVELEQYLAEHGEATFDRISKQVTKDLDAMLADLQSAGLSAEYVARAGSPDHVILEVVKEKRADLVAMGTHGRRGLSHLLLGSVAERVVRTAEAPVLTVRERK
ncbi:MAG TPA: universal stress protein [Myxococcota bacterium]|nr:universal stress protein [Myxococcota bacterium]